MSTHTCHLTSLRNDGRRPDRFLATGQPLISVGTTKKERVARPSRFNDRHFHSLRSPERCDAPGSRTANRLTTQRAGSTRTAPQARRRDLDIRASGRYAQDSTSSRPSCRGHDSDRASRSPGLPEAPAPLNQCLSSCMDASAIASSFFMTSLCASFCLVSRICGAFLLVRAPSGRSPAGPVRPTQACGPPRSERPTERQLPQQ